MKSLFALRVVYPVGMIRRNHIQELQEILLEQGEYKDSLKPVPATR